MSGPGDAGAQWGPRPVPWDGPVARLRACTTARRVVPTGLALLATDLLCRAELRVNRSSMDAAIECAAPIVAGTGAERDLPRVARRYAAARARGWELSWRPWEIERVPLRGRERLAAARATGRGVIVSHTHLGPLAAWVPLVRLLRPLLAPQGDWLLDDPSPGYNGYQMEYWRKIYQDAGAEMLHNTGSALRVYKTLRGGGSVLIAMDVPGDRRTHFLGKPVDLDDGSAHLAAKTDALIVPAALMPSGRRWEIQISEPLDPRDFSDPDGLHLTLASVHEELIMRAPEHLECPPLWLWGHVSREGWFRR